MIYINTKKRIDKNEWNTILDSLEISEKIKNAKTIAIKPNLAAGNKAPIGRHICSDIKLIKNIIELCHGINPTARILISEGDSTGDGFAYLKFKHFGFPDSLDSDGEMNVETLDLSRTVLTQIEDRRFRYFKNGTKLWLSKDFIEADFKISISNLKTHSVTLYTGACKNLFGCLPASSKSAYHPYIHNVIHDLTIAIHTDLNIVDAFFAMEKNGPVDGNDIDMGFRIISNDAVEADCYGTRLIGIKPENVKYLKYLKRSGLNPTVDDDLVQSHQFNVAYPGRVLRINNSIGLTVQRFGDHISQIGDRLHIARNPIRALISIFRPLLIKLFGLEKLKALKVKIRDDQ